MFQYQLEWYDLKAELARGALVEDWQASQHARQMRPGQVVYILKAGGRDGKDARQIEALGELCSEIYPTMGQDGKLYYSVNVRYRARIDPPLTRSEMLQDQVLRAYAEYTEGRQGTNFILPPDVAARTEQLVRHRLVSLSVSSNASRQQIEAQSSMDPGSLVGREYRRASDEFAGSEQITIIMDPEKLARANRSHATLQNKFAQYLRDREITPRSPRADEPAFDIAWSYGSTTFVAEVKSLTNENEETQLRLGLGQALIYRQLLSERYTHAEAILFLEREPTMASWLKLCESIGVLMLWPDQLTSGHTSRLDEWMIARGGSVPVRPAFFEQR